jgi:cell division protein FtsB
MTERAGGTPRASRSTSTRKPARATTARATTSRATTAKGAAVRAKGKQTARTRTAAATKRATARPAAKPRTSAAAQKATVAPRRSARPLAAITPTVVDPELVATPDGVAAEAPRRIRSAAVIWTSLVLVVAGGLIVLLIVPTRTWLDQKHQIAAAQKRLTEMNAAADKLQAKVDAVATPAEVERVAREQYGYSKPGEVVFSMSPAPAPTVPDTWPFGLVLDIITVRNTAAASTPPATTARSASTTAGTPAAVAAVPTTAAPAPAATTAPANATASTTG